MYTTIHMETYIQKFNNILIFTKLSMIIMYYEYYVILQKLYFINVNILLWM